MNRMSLKNFHLPLPEEVHEELKREAAATQQSTTALVRRVIELFLEKRRRERRREEIRAYAEAVAGSIEDLDPALEAAATELLLREEA